MRYLWLKPGKEVKTVFDHCKTCLIFKTLDRRGVLSTTGHFSNYVCKIELHVQKKNSLKHWAKRGVALVT
jgi:dynein heavy chain